MRDAIQDNRRAALENHQSLRLNAFKDLTVSLKAARANIYLQIIINR
jgi:hypothetical protein